MSRAHAYLDVLIVAQQGDQHADAVEGRLIQEGRSCARTSLNDWSDHTIDWSGNEFLVNVKRHEVAIGRETTVWWRRPGWFENAMLAPDELQLAQDETALILPGCLESASVRWVDNPWNSSRAGNRLVQLRTAALLGFRVPPTIVTNSVDAARRFVAAGETLAKTISTGPGLAPFVDRVAVADVGLVSAAPVVLQRALQAEADWRVVTVGEGCFAWRRTRKRDEQFDWRADDPAGAEFSEASPRSDLVRATVAIQDRLGLSFSVQDWLEVGDEFAFLEVNPQGQWLFLRGAETIIGSALARHLGRRRSA